MKKLYKWGKSKIHEVIKERKIEKKTKVGGRWGMDL